MFKRIIIFAFLINCPSSAKTEIDIDKIANLLKVPGLPMVADDQTERESVVRNIKFKKVIFLSVLGNRHITPAIIYVAPKGAIDKEKYDHQRSLVKTADPEMLAVANGIGLAYFPELDNAIVTPDQIKASQYMRSQSVEGGRWITPKVGGLSITATNEDLNIDYQILITGHENTDSLLREKYRKESDVSPDADFQNRMRELIRVVRDSPMMAEVSRENSPRADKRSSEIHGRDAEEREEFETELEEAREEQGEESWRGRWPWILAVVLLLLGVLGFWGRRRLYRPT